MNMTVPFGQRVGVISVCYVLEWKMKVVQIWPSVNVCGMYCRQHQPHQWLHVEDVAHPVVFYYLLENGRCMSYRVRARHAINKPDR